MTNCFRRRPNTRKLSKIPVKLSVVIPAYNEAESLPETLRELHISLQNAEIPHELLVVNDNSTDNTVLVLEQLQGEIPTLRYVTNLPPNGFGRAVSCGLNHFEGDCVAIMMADLSDSPQDLINFYNKMLSEDLDGVFGSRFIKGSQVCDYP